MVYEETWTSLKKHVTPDWLGDLKFGIYFHWGVYSVPAAISEWYPNMMYYHPETYEHHVAHYGEPDEFGYKDFIPSFTAENFDAGAWARLFKEAGAKFAGPVAEYADGFSMWASKVNKWNAAEMGPKRDIVGELAAAIKAQGLKFITTFHHAFNWHYYFHLEGIDTGDPEYASLYGKPHPAANNVGTSAFWQDRPDKDFCELWFAKVKEVVDNYEPDLIWFDIGLHRIHDAYKRKMAAYYYNKAEEWGREVEIIYKRHYLPPQVGLLDYELGRGARLTWHQWITDSRVGTKSWGYVHDEVYRPTSKLIHNFIDRIAKNGYLLLNFGPTKEGNIPPEVVERFKEMGEWFKVNGEACFYSTPWTVAEEGPTRIVEKWDGFNESLDMEYTAEDIRFVTRDNAIYAFVMGWPGEVLTIKSFAAAPTALQSEFYLLEDGDIERIEMLGNDGELQWKLTPEGLKISMPEEKPCEHAFTVKITWTDYAND